MCEALSELLSELLSDLFSELLSQLILRHLQPSLWDESTIRPVLEPAAPNS